MQTTWRAFFVLVLLASTSASAQRRVDIHRFRPMLDHDGTLGLQGTTTPGPLRWDAGLWTSYAYRPLRGTTIDGERLDVISHSLVSDLTFQLGLGTRVAIAADLPLLLLQEGDAEPLVDGRGALPSQALGDLRLMARVRVYGKDAEVVRERTDGPGIAVLAGVTVPTGSDDAFVAEDQATFDLRVMGDFHILGAGAGAMLGWRHRPNDRELGRLELRDQLLFGLGLKVPVPVVDGLTARLDVTGALDAREPFGGGSRMAIEGNLGASYRREGSTYVLGVGTGFTRGLGTPRVRATFGLIWSPRIADSDNDGVPDDLDECPHLPEDFDSFEDDDGCMDPDNDNDFIPDADDRCPNDEALEGRDEDEDGCTDPPRPNQAPEPTAARVEEDPRVWSLVDEAADRSPGVVTLARLGRGNDQIVRG